MMSHADQKLAFKKMKSQGLKMATLSIASARAMRDNGIDAIAALNTALVNALVGIPAEDSGELKLTFGKVMGEVIFEIINPAIESFPELAVDESAWSAIARAQAGERCDCDGKTDFWVHPASSDNQCLAAY